MSNNFPWHTSLHFTNIKTCWTVSNQALKTPQVSNQKIKAAGSTTRSGEEQVSRDAGTVVMLDTGIFGK